MPQARRPAPRPAPRSAPRPEPRPAPSPPRSQARPQAPPAPRPGPAPAPRHRAIPAPRPRPGGAAPQARPTPRSGHPGAGQARRHPIARVASPVGAHAPARGRSSAANLGTFVATAYGPPWGGIQGGGVTATGVNLRNAPHEYIVAVDPSVIPLHSELLIRPNPFGDDNIVFKAEDTGGAIKGRRIDFYDWRGRQSQDAWGRRDVTVVHVIGGVVQSPANPQPVYFNPLAHARVTPERIDQGVDYAGTGYLVAIADGVVTESIANGSGWEGEGYLEYKITQPGELEGVYIYYAEGINPVVRKDESVRGGARMADLREPMPHGIELGFAAGTRQWSYYRYHDGPYHEGDVTRPGLAFSNLVQRLGGPAGRQEGPVVGNFPEYMQSGEPAAGVTTSAEGVISAGGGPVPVVRGQFQWPGDALSAFVQLQRGALNGAHHSHAAWFYARGIEYVPKSD